MSSESPSLTSQVDEKREHDLLTPPSDKVESSVSEPPTAPPADKEHEWLSGFKLFTVVAAVTLVCLLVLLDTSIIVTAIPHITTQFHSLPDVGWYGSSYQLARYVVSSYFINLIAEILLVQPFNHLRGRFT